MFYEMQCITLKAKKKKKLNKSLNKTSQLDDGF